MIDDRHARQIALFGAEGQRKIGATRVVVVGNGGVGSAVIQQIVLLGVGAHVDIDRDKLEGTNRNRLIGATVNTPDGMLKADIMRLMSNAIDPSVEAVSIDDSFISPKGFDAIRAADWVLGCVDRDGARQVLLEFCAAY